jgi:phage terminase large subunit
MSILDIKATINFEFINDNVNDFRGLVLPGGTRSTKTISILQWHIAYCHKNKDKHVVICRDTLKNLKRTVLKDFIALCYGFGEYDAHAPDMILNKSELIAKIGSCTIEFIGLIDDPMRVHGLKNDRFYINEVISTYKSTFTQLNYRCTGGWMLDCNPSMPMHWAYELEGRKDVKFFRSSYLDNPFLNDAQVNEIESKQPTAQNIENGTADEREWSIYGLGEVYKGKDIIYPDWETYSGEITEYDHLFYGIDWGINHPLACIEVIANGNNLYLREVVYQSGIKDLESQLVPLLMAEKPIKDQSTYVICDSAEIKSVHTLVRCGVPAFGVKKPPGSVLTGIRKVAGFNIFVHEDSINLQNELNRYKWKVDSSTDAILDVPIKLWDDALDAVRYVVYTYL